MRFSHISYSVPVLGCVLVLLVGLPAYGHEADLSGPHTHKQLTAVITKIQSGLMFLEAKDVKHVLRPRAVSINKAERMGLHKARVGDEVVITVDEGNILLDVHEKGGPIAGHRLVIGELTYADPFWEVISVATLEGDESFAVDPAAGSKLNVLKEGALVRVELDEANVVIDIHSFH